MAHAELESAIRELGNHAAAVPLLVELAALEMREGQPASAHEHLLKSRLLEEWFRTSLPKAN